MAVESGIGKNQRSGRDERCVNMIRRAVNAYSVWTTRSRQPKAICCMGERIGHGEGLSLGMGCAGRGWSKRCDSQTAICRERPLGIADFVL